MKSFILHGSYTKIDDSKYWFPWLKDQLTTSGQQVIAEQFPTEKWADVERWDSASKQSYNSIQSLASWESFFANTVYPQIKNSPFNFIGHSIAPLFLLHLLEKYPLQIEKAVFVAPFFNIPDRREIWQFYPVNKTFYKSDFDFKKIKSKIHKSFAVFSDNDPYVPASEPPLFAKKLGSEIHLVRGGKHCGSNFPQFPLLIELLKNNP